MSRTVLVTAFALGLALLLALPRRPAEAQLASNRLFLTFWKGTACSGDQILSPTVPGDGSVTITVCAAVIGPGGPVPGEALTFATTTFGLVSVGDGPTSRGVTLLTDAAGTASLRYRGDGFAGEDRISVRTGPRLDLLAMQAITVTAPVPAPAPAPTPTPSTPTASTSSASTARFIVAPRFDDSGRALAVFTGGSVDDLAGLAGQAGASGAWVQDAGAVFRLYVVGGPTFLTQEFRAMFGAGFAQPTAVLLVR